jgi:hypothetical protein
MSQLIKCINDKVFPPSTVIWLDVAGASEPYCLTVWPVDAVNDWLDMVGRDKRESVQPRLLELG